MGQELETQGQDNRQYFILGQEEHAEIIRPHARSAGLPFFVELGIMS